MNKGIKLFFCASMLIMFFNVSYAQNTNHQLTDSSFAVSGEEIEKQDSLSPQTVTISDTTSIQVTESNAKGSVSTEKIRIYSGRHDGNNVIKSVEVPLPENSSNYDGAYIPH
jgi:hypothetical protein